MGCGPILARTVGHRPRRPRAPYPIVIGDEALAPPHTTVTVPVPGFVELPIFHDQLTAPVLSAVLAPSPAAVLFVPAGVTEAIVQLALGAACTVTKAVPPGRPLCTEVNVTDAAPDAGEEEITPHGS